MDSPSDIFIEGLNTSALFETLSVAAFRSAGWWVALRRNEIGIRDL
jgi:hypothetical protein